LTNTIRATVGQLNTVAWGSGSCVGHVNIYGRIEDTFVLTRVEIIPTDKKWPNVILRDEELEEMCSEVMGATFEG
jgi:hypothetical protein